MNSNLIESQYGYRTIGEELKINKTSNLFYTIWLNTIFKLQNMYIFLNYKAYLYFFEKNNV